jgi:hypothetical protein
MATLTWLHLSDWHQKGKDFDRKVVMDAMLKDIRQRSEISQNLDKIDFVAFSGDVAYSGQVQEYESAISNFFEPILATLGMDTTDNLFIVPGNHDIDWSRFDLLPDSILKPFSSSEEVNEWLTDPRKSSRLLEPFEAYSKFVAEYVNQDRGAYSYKKQFSINNTKVAVLGINSALICGRYRDIKGKVSDYGHLVIGEPQIHELLTDLADVDICISLLHHPFDWLEEFDRNRIEERMGRSCHFILCGHQHTPKVNIVHGTAGDCMVIPAGASYYRRVAEDPRYTNAYNFVHIDLESNKGFVYLRKWSDRQNEWIEDIDSYKTGSFQFDLPKISIFEQQKNQNHIQDQFTTLTAYTEEKKYFGSWFDFPQFHDQIIRDNLIIDLNDLLTTKPIVAIEGLSGSGKSYLVSSYLQSKYFREKYNATLWYDPENQDTLDNFLAHINLTIKFDGLSTISKCKELLHILHTEKTLLVIDNFERVDQSSYSSFLDMAARYGVPANLILISQIYVDLADASSHIGRLELRGFDLSTMRTYFSSRGLKEINNFTIQKLIDKTDGLPLAASLFTTLIKDFGEEAEELLSDERLSSTRRLHGWFSKICSQISIDENRLLQFLSMCSVPFNMALIRMACQQLGIRKSYEVFENLQRTYLVKKYSPYRWSMHNLISMFCHQQLEPENKKRINIALAYHYLFRTPKAYDKTILSDDAFIWKIRAARHFQEGKEFKRSERLISSLSRTAKARGHYEIFIQIISKELEENDSRNTWLDYDYAHCCLIIGRVKESLRVLEPIVYSTPEQDQNKRLAVIRLYAEILDILGKPEIALERLKEEINNSDAILVSQTVLQHAKSIEVRLLITLGQYAEAEKLCKDMLTESIQLKDFRGCAIGLTYLGLLNQSYGYHLLASKRLIQAVVFFRRAEDIRGLAWSLLRLSISKLELQEYSLGLKYLAESMQLTSDIGECSLDYLMSLNTIKLKVTDEKLTRIINEELKRVNTILAS